MRILFLTQIIPFPPDSGPKVKTWFVLNHLIKQGHQITLVSFVRPEEEGDVVALRELCGEVYSIPLRRSRVADVGFWLRSRFTGRPFLIERDDLPGMRQCVADLLRQYPFDFIHTDQLSMAQFALPAPTWLSRTVKAYKTGGQPLPATGAIPSRLVFDAHNAVWSILTRMGQTSPWYIRPLIMEEARRVMRYEGMLIARFDHTLAVTEIDRQMLLAATNGVFRSPPDSATQEASDRLGLARRIRVIPIAIDCRELQPVQRPTGSFNIITLGTLHYPPNADGIRWFARDVFPLVRRQVPQAQLTIIGKNPPADFQELAASQPDSIKVTGYVPDLKPELEQSAMIVVPVRAGSGMRVRILEAFARAMPVVTTTVGLEGIEAQPGKDVLVADTPAEFSSAVISLLQNGELQNQLAASGRSLAETRYDWRVVLSRLNDIYGPAIS